MSADLRLIVNKSLPIIYSDNFSNNMVFILRGKMNHLSKISLIMLIATALAGCSNNSQSKKANKAPNSNIKVTKTMPVGHLSSRNISPQKTVAVIVAYAGKRYPAQWGTALKAAKEDGLQVNLKNQSVYPYMKQGSGVAYMVNSNLGYTLKQIDNENRVYLFAGQKQIGSALIKQMVYYLNHHNSEKTVNALTKKAKVNDERNNEQSASDSNKTNLPGDEGPFNMPTAIQGTWFGYRPNTNKLTLINIGPHEFSWKSGSDGSTEVLHKMNPNFLNKIDPNKLPKSYQKATQNWCRASFVPKKVRNINWVNISGWLQTAGDGEYYGLHTEEGQTVLVSAHGAGIWADTVYWRSPALARQYKDKEFKGLGWDN